jgi:P-type E1-E2 ATPase
VIAAHGILEEKSSSCRIGDRRSRWRRYQTENSLNKNRNKSYLSFVRRIEKRILTQQLVPGDILCINPLEDKVPFHCDAVLVEGTCSVDESMLTGESYPITKVSWRLSKSMG